MNDSLLQRVTLDLNICHGKPCIRGLRYPIEFILELSLFCHSPKNLAFLSPRA
ncbi:DUF433 domain-containing protein [Planktothrix paucivesiculata]|nr:DUF433 domain-containing protein [Planktothrix paucivesiculata]